MLLCLCAIRGRILLAAAQLCSSESSLCALKYFHAALMVLFTQSSCFQDKILFTPPYCATPLTTLPVDWKYIFFMWGIVVGLILQLVNMGVKSFSKHCVCYCCSAQHSFGECITSPCSDCSVGLSQWVSLTTVLGSYPGVTIYRTVCLRWLFALLLVCINCLKIMSSFDSKEMINSYILTLINLNSYAIHLCCAQYYRGPS